MVRMRTAVKECFHMIVIPVLLALFCSKVLIVNANIPSGSMEDTIHPGDRVIGSRLAYLGKDPQRKDIRTMSRRSLSRGLSGFPVRKFRLLTERYI